MRWLHGIMDSVDVSLSKLEEMMNDGSLVCCSPWVCKELDLFEQLKNNQSRESSSFTRLIVLFTS